MAPPHGATRKSPEGAAGRKEAPTKALQKGGVGDGGGGNDDVVQRRGDDNSARRDFAKRRSDSSKISPMLPYSAMGIGNGMLVATPFTIAMSRSKLGPKTKSTDALDKVGTAVRRRAQGLEASAHDGGEGGRNKDAKENNRKSDPISLGDPHHHHDFALSSALKSFFGAHTSSSISRGVAAGADDTEGGGGAGLSSGFKKLASTRSKYKITKNVSNSNNNNSSNNKSACGSPAIGKAQKAKFEALLSAPASSPRGPGRLRYPKNSNSSMSSASSSPTSPMSKTTWFDNFGSLSDEATDRKYKVEGGDGNDEVKWDRSNSLRKPFHRTRTSSTTHDPAAALSDTELSKISGSLLDVEGGGSETSERAIDVGPVGAWATSFEKLLEDPAGLHTFAEFLKKEFSHENIYFWTACERYKRLSDQEERRAMAKTIFERHLCIGASEPVNVDSHARQVAQEGLHSPDEFLFEQAEKQIFNLMKFDSYSRFLKSNLYKDCMARDLRGQSLPYPGDDTLDPDLRISQDDSHIKLKKSKSDADERRRKSLLPWHRKDRSKSKDRGEAEYRRRKNLLSRGSNNSDSSSIRSDVTGSRTSLNSSDLALVTRRAVSRESLTSGEIGSLSGSEGYNRCRVMLPDLSNSVVAVRPGEAVRTLLTRLLDRRGLNYSTYDVFYQKGDKPVDQNEDSTVLGGQEVRVEQRVLFRLDLPSRKTVCVKAKPHKISQDVLKPILHKYGYKLDLMAIHKVGEEKSINFKGPVTELDNEKFVVQTKEGIKEWGVECGRAYKKRTNTLDEITNRVFEDLLKGKLEQNFDELGVLDFDTRSNKTDRSSDRSSSILGSFSRRNSLAPEKETKPRKPGNRSSVHEGGGVGRGMVGVAGADGKVVNVQAKRRGTTQTNSKQENDELYEGLKRAQRSRLDDQRGTEINFELPDFLKCDQQQTTVNN